MALIRWIAILIIAAASAPATAGLLNFDGAGIVHGSVVSTTGNSGGVITDSDFILPPDLSSIQAINIGGGPNAAVTFDSTRSSSLDDDLQFMNGGTNLGDWDSGNLVGTNNGATTGMPLGMLAIIQENDTGCSDGTCDSPDDEGTRPAGSLILAFDVALDSIGFDLIDVEGPSEFNDDAGFVAAFFLNDVLIGKVGFDEFIDSISPFYDPTIAYGNNSANRISPITAGQLGIVAFDKIEFNFGGSAAIDNILWTSVPEPTTLLLLGLGLAGLGFARRRPNR